MNYSMKIDRLHTLLKNANADYSILLDEKPIRTAAEWAARYGVTVRETTPTLILKTKDSYIAAIICGDSKISFEKLEMALGENEITLASSKAVHSVTNAHIGDVGLINPGIKTYIDSRVLENEECFGGCGFPHATLRIKTSDLLHTTQGVILSFAKVDD